MAAVHVFKSAAVESQKDAEYWADGLNCITNLVLESNILRLNQTKTQCIGLEDEKLIKTLSRFYLTGMIGINNQSSEPPLQILFCQLGQIRVIRRNLSLSVAETLVNSVIVTRLEFSNSFLANLPKFRLHQIQCVLNCAFRVVANRSKYSHRPITENTRYTSYWHPVVERIALKTIMLTHASIVSTAPAYTRELCVLVSNLLGSKRCALGPMEICTCRAVALQHETVVSSCELDNPLEQSAAALM